ncbi:uncharacterized protein LOC133190874 [Saccostrea echinata]|uniref:uncharacterized protein LOC133190874 n=1 Tax=Saccostrea echinata TaxID=191078 RepID=UPI002A818A7E|nr:uncharacterized protein LOC133190874 [Saccostrea echinata]
MDALDCDVIDMFRILAVLMLCLHVAFVTVVLIRHQAFEVCISDFSSRGNIDTLLGSLANGIKVCTVGMVRPMDLFNESVCQQIQIRDVHPSCHLNRALESPYRILLGGVTVLAFISLCCYHLISHGLLINALTILEL